jgi:endonuclease/exonuclease/phosphatase family metal-dependent hydrolase
MAQARRLLEVLLPEEGPVILAGDFNSTPDSAVMDLIGETFTVPDKGNDRFTFPSHRAEREIDFVAFRPPDRFAVVESRVIDEPVASDHRPVFLMLEIR